MKKYSFPLLFALVALANAASAQFRANVECKNFVLVSDSTYTGDLKRFTDQTNKNYLPSGVKVGYVVTDANYNNYKVDAINNTTFSSLNVTVTKLANGKNFPPFGSGQISENLKEGFLAVTPDNQSGVSPVVKSSIESEGFKNLADSLHLVLNKLIDTIYYEDSIFVVTFYRKGTEKDTLRFGGGGVSSWNDLVDIPPDFQDGIDNVDDLDNDATNELDSKWTRSGTNTYLTETADNVGIGTSSPSEKLEVSADVLVNSLTLGKGGGNQAANLVFGFEALMNNTTGVNNMAIGYRAGKANITNSNNFFMGYRAGENSLQNGNFFAGYQAGRENIGGYNNMFLGLNSGIFNTTGNSNMFLGGQSGFYNTTGNSNMFLGYNAGNANTTGGVNIFIGRDAAKSNTTGGFNTIIGFAAGGAQITAQRNLFLGYTTGRFATGSNNTFVGTESGYNATGNNSVFIGYRAGYNETGDNKLYIDNSNTTSPLVYGDFISNLLRVNGTLNINNAFSFPTTDGTANQILTTNGSGLVTWGNAPSVTETDPIFVASQANNITNSGSGLVITTTERNNYNTAFGWGNHSGLYEPVFAKNTAFNKNFGTSAGTVLEGNTTTISTQQANDIATALQPTDTADTGGFLATQDDLNNIPTGATTLEDLTNVTAGAVNGQILVSTGSVWNPANVNFAEKWSIFAATQTVDVANNDLSNIGKSTYNNTNADSYTWQTEEISNGDFEIRGYNAGGGGGLYTFPNSTQSDDSDVVTVGWGNSNLKDGNGIVDGQSHTVNFGTNDIALNGSSGMSFTIWDGSSNIALFSNGDTRIDSDGTGLFTEDAGLKIGFGDSSDYWKTDHGSAGLNEVLKVTALSSGVATLNFEVDATSSDISFKSNIQPNRLGLNEVLKMNTVTYNHSKTPTNSLGLIAQELENIIPDAIITHEGKKYIQYEEVVPVLILAIQQLNAKIENIKK